MANDVENLIDMIIKRVSDARSAAFQSGMCVIDRDEILELLEELRAQLPVELDRARSMLNERKKFLEDTQREVDQMRRQADLDAKNKVAQSEITIRAKREAREMIARADEQTRKLVQVTNEYVEDAMARTEEAISLALAEVQQRRVRFRAVSAEKMQERRSKLQKDPPKK